VPFPAITTPAAAATLAGEEKPEPK